MYEENIIYEMVPNSDCKTWQYSVLIMQHQGSLPKPREVNAMTDMMDITTSKMALYSQQELSP